MEWKHLTYVCLEFQDIKVLKIVVKNYERSKILPSLQVNELAYQFQRYCLKTSKSWVRHRGLCFSQHKQLEFYIWASSLWSPRPTEVITKWPPVDAGHTVILDHTQRYLSTRKPKCFKWALKKYVLYPGERHYLYRLKQWTNLSSSQEQPSLSSRHPWKMTRTETNRALLMKHAERSLRAPCRISPSSGAAI